jgi:tRNA-dihydrouridine synthase
MTRAVQIPVTVKMRAGWDEHQINAPELARRMEDAGAAAVAVHGRTAKQSYAGSSDWDLIAGVARGVRIPVFGSGDCVEAGQMADRLATGVGGVLVGRGALRNPWIFQQAAELRAGRAPVEVTVPDRGRFLLEYIDLLLKEGVDEAAGFRHAVASHVPARGRDRWVVNKLRSLGSWYSKGLDGGSRLRVGLNAAESVRRLREIIETFFCVAAASESAAASVSS